jgi:LmbE family N-acetylglucosaminyl deacetylase
MDKILVLCAHPDDETLGLGGTICLHKKKNDIVNVLIFATGQYGRDSSDEGILKRKNQGKQACKILGVDEVEFLDYEDQLLENLPLIELTNVIEKRIKKWKSNIVYTHFWGDVNQDHRRVFEASIIAARPKPNSFVKQILCYETPSSTEWGNSVFYPNFFVDITSTIKTKIKATSVYKNELESYPHPRSKESILNRSKFWGSSVGIRNAESFINFREIRTKS